MTGLQRFIDAQEGKNGFTKQFVAEQEITDGKKKGHWIWYVLPQLQGLGQSQTAKQFAIVDFKEACDYLANNHLRANYIEICRLLEYRLDFGSTLFRLMGETDAKKTVSSLTLFREVALAFQNDKNWDNELLVSTINKIFKKLQWERLKPCEFTLNAIKSSKTKATSFFAKEKPTPTPDLSQLSSELDGYIKLREKEWSFHYNFLGIMSVVYWLIDAFTGTDYYNNKSKDIKISAARKLKVVIDEHDYDDLLTVLTPAEKKALKHDRLGNLLDTYGGQVEQPPKVFVSLKLPIKINGFELKNN